MNPTNSTKNRLWTELHHLPAGNLQAGFKSHWLAKKPQKPTARNPNTPASPPGSTCVGPSVSLWLLCSAATVLSEGSTSSGADTWCDFSTLWCGWTHSVPGQSCWDWKRCSPVGRWYMEAGDQRRACLGIKWFKCSGGPAKDCSSVCVCVCSISCWQAAGSSKRPFTVFLFLKQLNILHYSSQPSLMDLNLSTGWSGLQSRDIS